MTEKLTEEETISLIEQVKDRLCYNIKLKQTLLIQKTAFGDDMNNVSVADIENVFKLDDILTERCEIDDISAQTRPMCKGYERDTH